jgi:hypothetical protein
VDRVCWLSSLAEFLRAMALKRAYPAPVKQLSLSADSDSSARCPAQAKPEK